MKRVLLPLALLGIASLILLLFWWTGASSREHASTQGGEAAAGAPSNATLTTPARELDPAAESAANIAADEANARESAANGIARRTLRGVVVAPANCTDTEREVLVLGRAMPWRELAGLLDDEVNSTPEDEDAESELAEAFGGPDLEQAARKAAGAKEILARAKVEADGAFALALPEGAGAADARGKQLVWIAVAGRFQYCAEAVEVDLARSAGAIELHAACGGAVRANVRVPEGVSAESALASELAHIGPAFTGMNGAPQGMSAVRRSAALHGGAFEFRALPTDIGYQLRLAPKQLAATELELPRPDAGRVSEVELRLATGGRVLGKVVDPAGQPLADASVRATTAGQWFGFDDRTVRRATTAADGTFELAAVTPGEITLRADHARYLEGPKQKLRIVDGHALEGVVLELANGATISGHVTWPDGTPADGVTVRVRFDMSQMVGMGAMNALQGGSGRARTDEQGAFTVTGLGKGPFTVVAEARPRAKDVAAAAETAPEPAHVDDAAATATTPKKRAPREEWQARLDGVAPGTANLALALAAPAGVRGRVVDEAGAPVTKFKLFAQRTGSGVMGALGQATTEGEFEDANGAFFLTGLVAGTWNVHATADDYAQREPATLEVPREDTEFVIVLAHAARVFGFVRDPLGNPVSGAEVEQATGGPNWERALRAAPEPPKSNSEAAGAFELAGLVPARVKLVARAKGFAASVPVEVDLASAPIARDVVLTLRAGATLTGEVFDDAGKPAVRWMVQVTDTASFSQEMAFTESDGRFRVEHLEPGPRQIVAMPSGAPQAAQANDGASGDAAADLASDMTSFVSKLKMTTATLVDAEETHVVLGAPPRAPVDVSGSVTHAGAPYAGAMISFVRRGGEKHQGMSGFKLTAVDPRGHYQLTLPEPGEYSVSIQKFGLTANQQGLVEFMRDVPEQKNVKLDFELPTGRISGRVRGPDGNAASGTRISIHAEGAGEAGTLWGGSYNESMTDSEGRYDVQALKPGKYTVFAGGMALGGITGDAGLGRETKAGLTLDAGQWLQDVDFKLRKPGAIDITVVDENGAPVSNANIFVRASGGELLDQFSMSTTGDDGVCKYGGLSEGRYTVCAREGARTSGDSSEIAVRTGERATAKLVLARGTYLVVNVVDSESKAVQASVSVRDEAGREVGAVFSLADIMARFSGGGGSTDDQRVGPLSAGKYVVTATTSDGKTTKKSVSLNGQEERKLTIRF